jgi:hypothetical protein
MSTYYQTATQELIIKSIEEVTQVPKSKWMPNSIRTDQAVLLRTIYIHMLYHKAKWRIINIQHEIGLNSNPTVLQAMRSLSFWEQEWDPFEYEMVLYYKVESALQIRLEQMNG